jgi:hypothetical protein
MGRIVALIYGNFIGIFLEEEASCRRWPAVPATQTRREDAAASAEAIR